jgi:hypothetical protein
VSVPTNLIPTKITGLPEYDGTSQLGFFPYVLEGRTYKVQFAQIAATSAVPPTRSINTGVGLAGGGNLTQDRTIYIANEGVGYAQLNKSGVVAGTYGNALNVPAITVDDTGRVTSVVSTPIVLPQYVPTSRTITAGTGLSGGGDLSTNRTLSINFSSATPQPLGVATAGSGTQAARDDHVHPAVDLSDITETQGVLPLARGGTGNALSPVVGAVAYSSSDKLYLTPTAGNAGQVLTSAGGVGAPYWQTITGTGTVTSVNLTAGTGISVAGGPITTAGSITVTNTAPDQIVSLTGAGTTTVTGTYPNFTITSTDAYGGTVTSVAMTVPTGLQVTGSPITTSGTLAVSLQSGYSIPTTASQANWDTAYTDRLKWDGGATGLVAATGRTSLGATTVGGNFFTLTNPSAITFPRINADNTVSALDAASFRTAIGAGTGSGTVTSVNVSGNTTGLTFTGGPITTSGTLTLGGTLVVANGGTGATTAAGARTNLGAAASGANSDITSMSGITGSIGSPTYIQFGNGSGTTLAAGRMWYDQTTGSLNMGMGGGNITQQIGEELFVYGKASAAITDSPLQIVYQTGTVGASGVITFAPTVAGITDGNMIVGVATENIALNGFGRVTSFGIVHGITTNGTAYGEVWADGDVIWYNPVTGNPTNVKPVAPNIKVQVGILIKAGSGGSGSIQVEVNHGSVLGGTDSNVQITSVANNDLLQYSSSLGYWRNVALTSTAVTSFSGGTTGLTPSSATTGAITLGGTLNVANGGTGQTSYTNGQLLIGNTTGNTLTKATLTAGTNISITNGAGSITINATDQYTGTVTSVAASGGTTGLTFTGSPITTSGTITLAGTLGVANGGTGATTLTSGYLVKGNGASAVSASVVYDNGTNVGIGTSSPSAKLHVRPTTDVNHLFSFSGAAATYLAVNDASSAYVDCLKYANTFQFYTASTERMRILASGNVGVGTSSPNSKLEVFGGNVRSALASASSATLRGFVMASDSTEFASLKAEASSGETRLTSGFTAFGGYTTFYTNGSERARIDSSGNVGIGTTSPSSFGGYTSLTVSNPTNGGLVEATNGTRTIRMQSQASGSALIGTTTSHSLGIMTAGVERVTLDTSGNVGIATTTPQRPLHVFYDSAVTGQYTMVLQGRTGGYGAGVSFQSNLTGGSLAEMARITADGEDAWNTTASTQDAGLRFYTSLDGTVAEKMRITSAGNVGIGTTAPSYTLDVRTNASNALRVGSSSNAFGTLLSWDNPSGEARLTSLGAYSLTFGTNSTERMRIDSSGNVGIGTSSPVSKLHVNTSTGAIYSTTGNDAGGTQIGVDTSGVSVLSAYATNAIRFGYNSGSTFVETMRLSASGNLSIGTTSPGTGTILDVQSTTKGVRFPNMTTTQKNAITPAAGTVVFDTTLGKLCLYTGAAWQTITSA